jgi:solute carrier family 25 S-adenosylmethionine transporter 26
VYKNPLVAARAIVAKAGARGLFTGLVPTVLEDIPDMAVKFAAYESLRGAHETLLGRRASTSEELLMGGGSGALAAAATTPFDVVKTRMMCNAASRPKIWASTKEVSARAERGTGGYSDEKVANREIRVWHFVIGNGY